MKRFASLMTADLNDHFQIQFVQETDKPFLAETVKLRTHQRGHFRLLDAKKFGRFRLRVSLILDDIRHYWE